MSDPDYCYPPEFAVLRNKLKIRDASTLEAAERQLVAQRVLETLPTGDFDLDHLSAIHCHLFQDIYEWAGEIRTVEISKGGTQIQPRRFIETPAWRMRIAGLWLRPISRARARRSSPTGRGRFWAMSITSIPFGRATVERNSNIWSNLPSGPAT